MEASKRAAYIKKIHEKTKEELEKKRSILQPKQTSIRRR
jgi:hypothetical protein